jgi:hypothetical protein
MRTGLFICAAMLAAVAGLRDTQDRKKSDADKPVIAVTGCVDGSWLHVRNVDTVGSYTVRYRLRGSKQVLKELAAHHNGHLVDDGSCDRYEEDDTPRKDG